MGDTSAHGAWRCGECHDKMQEEWSQSAHAKAAKSPLFIALKQASRSDQCDRCHIPLRELPGTPPHIVSEGVTCEVCHRMEEPTPARDAPGVELRHTHDVKYGPFCDANQRYFHKSECRPYFESSALCGSCHLWYQSTNNKTKIPVYTEYEDYKALGLKKQCQDCHMPGSKGSAAVSEKIRESIANHSFLGEGGELRDSGLDVSIRVVAEERNVRATGTITNARAGHALPAGMAGRQLVLRLCAQPEDGVLKCGEVPFERKLVDATGKPVPFFSAVRVAADTRLRVKKPRSIDVSVDLDETAGSSLVRLELVDRQLSPEIAKALGVEAPERQILQEEWQTGGTVPSVFTVSKGK